jgi:hypothetical protein
VNPRGERKKTGLDLPSITGCERSAPSKSVTILPGRIVARRRIANPPKVGPTPSPRTSGLSIPNGHRQNDSGVIASACPRDAGSRRHGSKAWERGGQWRRARSEGRWIRWVERRSEINPPKILPGCVGRSAEDVPALGQVASYPFNFLLARGAGGFQAGANRPGGPGRDLGARRRGLARAGTDDPPH